MRRSLQKQRASAALTYSLLELTMKDLKAFLADVLEKSNSLTLLSRLPEMRICAEKQVHQFILPCCCLMVLYQC